MNVSKEANKITIKLDEESLKRYDEYDSKMRPKRKKKVLSWCGKTRNGCLPSLNVFLNVSSRMEQNSRKQAFSSYVEFVIDEMGISDLNIKKCFVIVRQYKGDKRKFDVDNILTKSFMDALVKKKVITEDNYTVVPLVILTGSYDKGKARSEITIYPINDSLENTKNILSEVGGLLHE